MKKLVITIIGIAVLIASAFAQTVDRGTCGDNLKWTLTGSGDNLTLTIKGKGVMNNYGNGAGETSPWSSYRSDITTLVIKKGITTIGENAFSNLTNLTSVTIPNSVVSIRPYAFFGCIKLQSITIPRSVEIIGEEFVVEPKRDISDHRYKDGGFYKVAINTLIKFGDSVFGDCPALTAIDVEPYSPYYGYSSEDGVLFREEKTTLVKYPAGKSGSYSIPNSVKTIGTSSFSNCKGLTSITIPNSVKKIEERAFEGCENLTSITIPNSVIESIGMYTFLGCKRLTSITIGNSISKINHIAFYNCDSLSSINVGEYNSDLSSEDGILFNKNKTAIIKYPPAKSGSSYIIPNSVTTIEERAFEYCENLEAITIPKSVRSIGWQAFANCKKLNSITVQSSNIDITGNPFSGCDALTVDIKSLIAENKQKEEAERAQREAQEKAERMQREAQEKAEKAQKAIEAKKYEDLAWKYYRMKEMDEADKQADLALAIHSTADMNFIKAQVILSKINWPRKDTYHGEYNTEFRSIVSYCNEALSAGNCSEMEMLYFSRGYSNNMLHYYSDGISDFHAVLRLNPNNALANYNIGVAHYNQKSYERALTYFKAAREIGFSNKDDENDNFDMIKKCGEKLK